LSKNEVESANAGKGRNALLFSGCIFLVGAWLSYTAWKKRHVLALPRTVDILVGTPVQPAAQSGSAGPVVIGTVVGSSAQPIAPPAMLISNNTPPSGAAQLERNPELAATPTPESNAQLESNNVESNDVTKREESREGVDGPTRTPSKLENADSRMGNLVQQNPQAFRATTILVPAFFLGGGIMMIVLALIEKRPFYENYNSLMQMVGGVLLLLILSAAALYRLMTHGARFCTVTPQDNPVRIFVWATQKGCLLILPLLGSIGLVWGLLVGFFMPAAMYNAECGHLP
jgi:hypothetical protein